MMTPALLPEWAERQRGAEAQVYLLVKGFGLFARIVVSP